MMQYYCRMEKEVFGVEGGALHDPVTIAWLIAPEILKFEPMYVEVDRLPGPSYGRTNCDQYHLRGEPANAMVATDIDVERFWSVVEETLKKERNQ
jgi:ribosylpyrimidine nucleosidase